jgi:hypothetical protein
MNIKNIIIATSLTTSALAHADVYVHGRDPGNTRPRGYNQDYGYWVNSGVNLATANADGKLKQAFNWDGSSRVVTSNTVVAAFYNGLPSGSVVRCHSAGCLIAARAIYLYGGSRFQRVVAGSSAEGGSELASIMQPDQLTYDLQVNAARSFSHNTTVSTFHGGGSKSEPLGTGTWGSFFGAAVTSPTLPGEDDGAVAYHSTLGKASAGKWCDGDSNWWNPATYGCTAWNKGANYTGHVTKAIEYSGHSYGRRFAARAW